MTTGIIESLAQRVERLEKTKPAPAKETGWKTKKDMAAFLGISTTTLSPLLVAAIAQKRVRVATVKGGIRKLYNVADVEREVLNIIK